MPSDEIGFILKRLRKGILNYVSLELLSWTIIGLGLAAGASLGLDFILELGWEIRAGIIIVAGVGFVSFFLASLFTRVLVHLSPRQLALTIERLVPNLKDHLITAVELQGQLASAEAPAHAAGLERVPGRRSDAAAAPVKGQLNPSYTEATGARLPYSRALAEAALAEATEEMRSIDPAQLFDRERLRWSLGGAILIAAAWAGFAASLPEVTDIWFRRNVLLDAACEWPHQTSLSVIGFDNNKKILVAKGADFPVHVVADPGGVIPDRVQIRYWMRRSGSKGKAYLIKVGTGEFIHQFKGLLEPVEFEVRGGDDREGYFLIETVPPPTIHDIQITCDYPGYTGLKRRTFPGNTLLYNFPFGTHVSLRGEAGKALSSVTLLLGEAKNTKEMNGTNNFSFEFDMEKTMNVSIGLRDLDGIENHEAVRFTFVARPDTAPKIDMTLRGIRQSITSAAVIPVRGAIEDDYGIQEADFQYQVDKKAMETRELSEQPRGRKRIELKERFDVSTLKLVPKQKLKLGIVARDGDTLRGPNVGKSRYYTFEVVTPDELLAQIAARELNLRRRFERAIEEVKQAKKDLERVKEDTGKPDAQLKVAILLVEKVQLGTRKNQNEVAGISQSYQEILLELRNNRIELPGLLARIEKGVCIPLVDITTNRFPKLDGTLDSLKRSIRAKKGYDHTAVQAVIDVTALIEKMEQVLPGMLELEKYKKAIELLRNIIKLQKNVEKETEALRKKKIHEILEP